MAVSGYKKNVDVDGQAIRSWAEEKGLSLSEISSSIGNNSNFLSGVCKRGCMGITSYIALTNLYGLPEDAFIVKENNSSEKKVVEEPKTEFDASEIVALLKEQNELLRWLLAVWEGK